MRVIPPVPVTAALLTSSSVSEPSSGEATWASGTVYKLGDQVINTTTHRTYESQQGAQKVVTMTIASPCIVTWTGHGLAAGTPILFTTTGALPTGITAGTIYYVLADTVDTFKVSATIGGAAINTSGSQSGTHTATANPNKGHDPTTDDGTWWVDAGPSNKWAMFDLLRNTGTTATSPIVVVITPGRRIDSVGLVGLIADTVRVQMSVSGSPVYDETVDLLNRPVVSWYEYFTAEFSYDGEAVLFDLPPETSAVITVTISRATGPATCGGLVIGQNAYLGRTLHSAQFEALNFSKIERDEFGNTILVQRRSVPRTTQSIRASKANVPKLLLLIDALNAVPALWFGIDDQASGFFPALLILGVYKRFSIDMDQPEEALITLELEEN